MNQSSFPDVPSLGLATVVVATLLGGLLLLTWLQNRQHRAMLYWAPAHLLIAAGLGLLALRGSIADFLSISIANAAILLAIGLVWAGAAAFRGSRVSPLWLAIPPVAWIVACELSFFAVDIRLRIASASLALAVLAFFATLEFWRGRTEPLMARWPVLVLLGIYVAGMTSRIFIAYLAPLPDESELFRSPWFGVTALSTLVFVTILPFLLLALIKERSELLYKRAALTDALTDLRNRRSFLAAGESCFERHRIGRLPLAALIFDLDRFKQVNDQLGHAAGDSVLRQFSEALRSELRGEDILGRIGGEEFAALLPHCDEAGAFEAAERVRRVFAETTRRSLPEECRATVSIGIAVLDGDSSLAALLARADDAVYCAKRDGRNCIRSAAQAHVDTSPASLAPQVRAA